MKFYYLVFFALSVVISGCITASAVISGISPDALRVDVENIHDESPEDMRIVDAEAKRGCAVYDKVPKRISFVCKEYEREVHGRIRKYKDCSKRTYLYACLSEK